MKIIISEIKYIREHALTFSEHATELHNKAFKSLNDVNSNVSM